MALVIATLLELVVYKIPFLVNLLDAMGGPGALGAGAFWASQFLIPYDSSMLVSLLAAIAGAGSAGIVHGTNALVRAVSVKTTGGIASPVVPSVEFVAAGITTAMSLFVPVLAGVFLVVTLAIALRVIKRRRNKTARLVKL